MQIPRRRAQILKKRDEEGAEYVTAAGLDRMKREQKRLLTERPEAIEEVKRLAALGDFSENVEYQEAKHRLRRINDRIESLKDRIMRAKIIHEEPSASGRIRLGSTVILKTGDGPQKVFRIVGPQETDPSHGRISHLSPLGRALIDHNVGDTVAVKTDRGEIEYRIIDVR